MKNKKVLAIDTNIFIYFFEGNHIFGVKSKEIFSLLAENKVVAITSVITQIELLSLLTTEKETKNLLHIFLEIPHLKVVDVNHEIAIEAARIRRHYHFRTPDAIQLATALHCKADEFVTNDKKLLKCKEIKMRFL